MENFDKRKFLKFAAAGTTASIFGIPMHVAAQAAKGGVLVIGTTQKPRHLNSAVQSGIATMMPASQLFASLIRMDANWKPQPYLAERWDLSPDNRSVTLYLRKDAVFHDGKPITAEDVKFSIEAHRDNHPFKTLYGAVNAVTVADPHTAVIRLSEPHPAVLLGMSTSAITPILPKHIFGDGTDLKVHPRNANPIGSGPFKLVEFKPGEFTVLERFDKFFLKDTPKLNRIIIREFKDTSSLMLAFERGEIDIHSELTDAGHISRANKMPNVTVSSTTVAAGPLAWLALNTKSPKLADKRVRQAINFAIDKKYLLETLLGKVHTRSTGPITSGSPFYEPKVEKYDLNLQKAAQLLDEAGLKPGANGIRLSIDLDYIPGINDFVVCQEYIKIALLKVGIEVNVRASPDFPSWARRVASHQFDMTLDSVWNWGDPVIGVHRTWLSSNIKPGIIWSNTQSYSNPKVDELLANAAKETSMAKRKAMYSQMQKIVVDECPAVFIIESTFNMAFHGKIQNRPAGIWGLLDGINDSSIKA